MSEVVVNEEFVEEFEDKGFSIKDDHDAEYALRRIRESQAEVDSFREYYDEQIQKMQSRADGIRGFYTGHLQRYFESVPHKSTPTSESYELPSAKLVWKQQKPEFIRNKEEIIRWLKENDETGFIKIKEDLDWEGLKKKVNISGDKCVSSETGEVIPGVTVQYREPKFDVTFKKEG